MVDEAFALSPIGARATQPSEADYEAIREAFMETARGRWFLGEYAKRNRNADTSMVLDAVARIEATLAAQRIPPDIDDRLPEALAAIRSAVDEAAQATSTAIDGLGLDQSLAPIRKGALIVREISWRWREIGADSRICDLIDSQVSAIEGSCGQIAERDPRPAVNDAFDLIRTRIDGFSETQAEDGDQDDEKAVAPAADEIVRTAAAAMDNPLAIAADPEVAGDMLVAADARDETFLDETVLDEMVLDEMVLDEMALHETVLDAAEVDDTSLGKDGSDEDVVDEAVLDMVALAMGAPDPDGEIDYSNPDPEEMVEQDRVATTMAFTRPEPTHAAHQSSLPPAPQSIGSALLANGFLEQHRAPANDPLAPIRRMSQAEKIALFS